MGGKADWAVQGLPMEGSCAGRRRAVQVARKDVPTCRPNERLGDVRERVTASGQDQCVVVNDDGIVFGRLRRKAWERDPEAAVEDVMELGPVTIRPDVFLHDIVERLQRRRVGSVLVTDSGTEQGGRFLGLLSRSDIERTIEETERAPETEGDFKRVAGRISESGLEDETAGTSQP